MKRLIIAGSRGLNPTVEQISALVSALPEVLICGCAGGGDRAGHRWARSVGVPAEYFPAWEFQAQWARSVALPGEIIHPLPMTRGKGAGYARNVTMGGSATGVLLLWDGSSRGTLNMRDIALRLKIPVTVKVFPVEAPADMGIRSPWRPGVAGDTLQR